MRRQTTLPGIEEAAALDIERHRRETAKEERRKRAAPMDVGLWGPERDQLDLVERLRAPRSDPGA